MCAAWPAKAGVDLFDDLYRRGQQLNGELRTFTANFTESTTSPLLARPLVARGTVAVERPFRVALHYAEPEERSILIDGDRMTVTWPSREIRQSKDIGASRRRIQKYFVEGSPDELRTHFNIAATETDDGSGAYLVTMTPKRKQIKEGLSRLELWVDGTTLLMSSMRMTFPNGQEKLMTFTSVKPNAPIAPATFRDRGGSSER
jgi:outer membrane lipoprotein-sorting protein